MREHDKRQAGSSSVILAVLFLIGLAVGGTAVALITYREIGYLQTRISDLQKQVSRITGNQTVTYQNVTIYQNSTALIELYESVKDSVVLIQGTSDDQTVQGSGFVYNYSGTVFVITNYHVVHGATSLSVTFPDGNGYTATVNGSDAYADLAVVLVDAPETEFKPIQIVASSTLMVGEPVIAIGNPYGLVGSMTTGVISALGRTITEDYTGGFAIANIIQISAPINPGNSGGPLLNYQGNVVGITTAIVADSQGLGFAIPSNTILRELPSLIASGSYEGHSYLGVRGTDMSYEMAQQYNVSVTYGWRVAEVTVEGPSYHADIRAGDVLVGINGTRIRNSEDMATFLEENTLPGETAVLTVVRGDQTPEKAVVLGKRPPP